jgi:hypothetical protein
MAFSKKKSSKPRQSQFPKFIHQVVSSATACPQGREKPSAIPCWKKPGHRKCPGRIIVSEEKTGEIEWKCPSCRVFGTITGWQGGWADLSDLRMDDGKFHFEIELSVPDYDRLQKYLSIEPEADLVIYSAIYSQGNVILRASDFDLKVFADILSFDAVLESKASDSLLLSRVLKGIKVALGEWSTTVPE